MNIIKTTKTYKTQANALAALDSAIEKLGRKEVYVRYLVAAIGDRFAPVVVGARDLQGNDNLPFAILLGITVVG